MKKSINISFIVLTAILVMSCTSKKEVSNSESMFYTDSIYSTHLSEFRKHSVYLPKGFDKENEYSVIYATDGNSNITNNKITLDSLIENKIIKPLIFIASNSNHKIADSTSQTTGDGKPVYLSYRNFEYVNRKPTRIQDSLLVKLFENHMQYFVSELIPEVEKEFNQKIRSNDRYFYGVSNGAGFGMSLLNSYPKIIGTYLCFSTFGGDIQSNTWKEGVKYPNLYMQYGSKEPFFLKMEADFLKSKYKELGLFAEIKEFEGGHYNKHWKREFIEIISSVLKPSLTQK